MKTTEKITEAPEILAMRETFNRERSIRNRIARQIADEIDINPVAMKRLSRLHDDAAKIHAELRRTYDAIVRDARRKMKGY